ncbi:MAG TPA: hypothetical protein DIW30_03865 [Bacteroidales bacterium]|nr:hypothetical protein [Bacteroidales bacterium]
MHRLAKIVFAALLVPVTAGIATGYVLCSINLITTLTLVSVVICLLTAGRFFLRPPYKQYVTTCGIVLLFYLISWARTSYCLYEVSFPYFGEELIYKIQITSIPEQKDKTIRCEAHLLSIMREDSTQTADKRILVSFAKDSLAETLQRGDILLARTTIVNPNRGNPEEFKYDEYLRQHGLCGTAYITHNAWEYMSYHPIHTLKAYAESCQHRLSRYFSEAGLHGDEWGVVCALTIGNRDGLDADMKQHYSAAGAMHVLAVSGLHVGIVYGALLLLLTGFGIFPIQYAQKKRKIINTIILLIALWGYAFITGLSASVMRSALMFSLLTIGASLDRETNTFNTIAASATILLLLHPLLLFSVSFILSYSAVVAIVGLQPSLQNLLPVRNRFIQWLWGLITVSIAAQTGTMPWTMYWFSQTSNWFILTNIVVVPMAGVILYTAIAVLLAAPWPPLVCLVAKVLNTEALILNKYVEWIESIPYSTSEVALSAPMLLCLCIFIASLSVAFVKRKRCWLIVSVASMLCLLGTDIIRTRQILHQDELIVYNAYDANVLFYQQGRNGIVITDDSTAAQDWTKNLRLKRCIKEVEIVDISASSLYVFRYAQNEYILVRDSLFERYCLDVPEKTDYLLLGDIGRVSAQNILQQFEADSVILLPTMRYWKVQQMRRTLRERNMPYFDVREGAFIVKARHE